MEPARYLISPRVAIATAALAGTALVLAIVARTEPTPAPQVAMPQPPPTVDAGAPPADPVLPSVPPTIAGAKAKASIAEHGVELAVDAAVTLAGPLGKRESVVAKASCKIDGEWYAGTGYLMLARAPTGTSVIATTVRVGTQHVFTTLPTACQLGFEYTSFAEKPLRREWLARMCWNGTAVSDHACATEPSTDLTVASLRVSTKYGFEVSLDAELKRPLDDKRIDVAADCTLPDGTTQHATARVFTSGVHAGRPFTSRTWLFGRMPDVPASCTLAVEVADLQQLVHEPAGAFCWKGGDVTSGACRA